jgi:hypothetical protein
MLSSNLINLVAIMLGFSIVDLTGIIRDTSGNVLGLNLILGLLQELPSERKDKPIPHMEQIRAIYFF